MHHTKHNNRNGKSILWTFDDRMDFTYFDSIVCYNDGIEANVLLGDYILKNIKFLTFISEIENRVNCAQKIGSRHLHCTIVDLWTSTHMDFIFIFKLNRTPDMFTVRSKEEGRSNNFTLVSIIYDMGIMIGQWSCDLSNTW